MDMVSPSQADRIIGQHAKPVAVEEILLSQAVGRLLRENLIADRHQPSFNKSLMDGVAIAFESWQKGQRAYLVEAVLVPGMAPKLLKNKASCVRVMTGAALPKACDCVIPIEDVLLEGDTIQIKVGVIVKKYQYLRLEGADAKKGDLLLRAGSRLWAPQVGIVASCGKSKVRVSVLPKIAVIATGDELTDLDKPVTRYQTRFSNAYALQALLDQAQVAVVDIFHLRDNPKLMLQRIKGILSKFDAVILSGGMAVGDFDYVAGVLDALGIQLLFNRVSQKPGKPFGFGVSKKGQAVFALPGNPVSTLICAYRYVIPYFKKISGVTLKQELIPVLDRVDIQSDLTYFLPVAQGRLIAMGGSDDCSSLARADGFIEYESHKLQNLWPYFSWRA